MNDRKHPREERPWRARNGTVEGTLKSLLSFAAAVAAVLVFAWASQARQDEAIRRNTTAIAVLAARLDAICEKLDDIRELLAGDRGARDQ